MQRFCFFGVLIRRWFVGFLVGICVWRDAGWGDGVGVWLLFGCGGILGDLLRGCISGNLGVFGGSNLD